MLIDLPRRAHNALAYVDLSHDSKVSKQFFSTDSCFCTKVKNNFQGTGIVSPLDGVVQIHEKGELAASELAPLRSVQMLTMPSYKCCRPKEKTEPKFGSLAFLISF